MAHDGCDDSKAVEQGDVRDVALPALREEIDLHAVLQKPTVIRHGHFMIPSPISFFVWVGGVLKY